MSILTKLFEMLFGCWHCNLGPVFTIGRRTYRVCCDCGAEFDYSLETMSIQRPAAHCTAHHALHGA